MEFEVRLSIYENDTSIRSLVFNVESDMTMDELGDFFDAYMNGNGFSWTIASLH